MTIKSRENFRTITTTNFRTKVRKLIQCIQEEYKGLDRTLYLILDIPGSGRTSQKMIVAQGDKPRGKPVVDADSVSKLCYTTDSALQSKESTILVQSAQNCQF